MKKYLVFWFLLFPIFSFSSILIDQILSNPSLYQNEVVEVEGFVTQYQEATAKTTSFFLLKDDYGSVIKVRTTKTAPEVGLKYKIKGPVNIDNVDNMPYISEEERIFIPIGIIQPPQQEEKPVPTETKPIPTTKITGNLLYYLIGTIILVFFILLLLLFWLIKTKKQETSISSEISIPAEIHSQAQTIEGKTIKMYRPPEGTLKIVPGYFEVLSGDDLIKEIRFYKLKEQPYPSITFGRASGNPYTHIQLKPMTVSSRQAKLDVKDGKYLLQNFATEQSNPTILNGREMMENEIVELKDGDKVAMGEITLKFHIR